MAKAKTADHDSDGAAEDAPSKSKHLAAKLKAVPRKMIMIVAGALLLVGGGGGAAYMLYSGKAKEAATTPAVAKPAAFVDLPEILVNLSSTGSDRTQYLKVRAVLELPDQALMQQIQPVMPRVIDTFQTYLRELRATDLEGSAGLYRLKEELTRRVNALIAPQRVNAVLFKEIVVQ